MLRLNINNISYSCTRGIERYGDLTFQQYRPHELQHKVEFFFFPPPFPFQGFDLICLYPAAQLSVPLYLLLGSQVYIITHILAHY